MQTTGARIDPDHGSLTTSPAPQGAVFLAGASLTVGLSQGQRQFVAHRAKCVLRTKSRGDTMITRRMILTAFWPAVCILAISLPYSLEMSSAGLAVVKTGAFAGNGNGGGGGNGGSGGGSGGGNAGGNSGGNSKSNSSGRGNAKANGQDVGVRHQGGITEEIVNGRYIMKDGRGRTIINRRATANDRKRIDSFLH